MANLVITGSRKIHDPRVFKSAIKFHELEGIIDHIYVGCAKGIDKSARDYAEENGIKFTPFKADWNGLGNIAGNIRNIEMLKAAQEKFTTYDCKVLAIPCPESKGTYHCIVYAKLMGFTVLPYDLTFHNAMKERWQYEKSRGFAY